MIRMDPKEVLEGLKAPRKRLSPKFFYDRRGSELFEQITEQDEYYLARSETDLLRGIAAEASDLIGVGKVLVEFGSGASRKTRILLDAVQGLRAYVPIDISGEFLNTVADRLRADYPSLSVLPVCADFTEIDRLPFSVLRGPSDGVVGFFPGSTLGNFDPDQGAHLLRNASRLLGKGGKLLLGVDPFKDSWLHERAYNDANGVTREFNLNLLMRMNNELEANFDLDAFDHLAFFNPSESRVEMHLVSKRKQRVYVAGEEIAFGEHETIHTENSYKFTDAMLRELFIKGGFQPAKRWSAVGNLFSVHLLEVESSFAVQSPFGIQNPQNPFSFG